MQWNLSDSSNADGQIKFEGGRKAELSRGNDEEKGLQILGVQGMQVQPPSATFVPATTKASDLRVPYLSSLANKPATCMSGSQKQANGPPSRPVRSSQPGRGHEGRGQAPRGGGLGGRNSSGGRG